MDAPDKDLKMQRSGRDATTVPPAIAGWIGPLVGADSPPEVTLHSGIDANGMSSETLVLDIDWTSGGTAHRGEYVARVAPATEDVPVFETYDLTAQFETIRMVGEITDVPVPRVEHLDETGTALGTPAFLMERVEGVVPPDVLPYTFGDNWLFDATPEQQRALQDATVKVVADLHAIPDPAGTFGRLDPLGDHPGTSTRLAANLAALQRWYDFCVPDIGRSPTAEAGLAWLHENLGTTEASLEARDDVLCWGDSRIGNVLYRDFAPVAVLDWEMATIGPREMDISWMLFAHQVFETIAGMLELPGMPHFLAEADVRATYRDLTGVELADLTWFHIYNAVTWCCVFMRTGARQIHFGEIEPPADLETLMHHKPLLIALLENAGA